LRHLARIGCLLLLLQVPAVAGEIDIGTIRGIVVDTSGGTAIGGASVRRQSSGRTVVTDEHRGVEWSIQRQAPNGLSGWASYALGFARYHDTAAGEPFWGHFDQRHTVNLYGMYRVSDRLSVSGRFRAGSNFLTTGYWTERGGAYFVGTERNTLRVPAYARLDARANRTFTWSQRRLTLFVEAINILGVTM
jgi:hypothetical protein